MMMTPPNRRHQRITSNLESLLNAALEPHDPLFAAYHDIGVNVVSTCLTIRNPMWQWAHLCPRPRRITAFTATWACFPPSAPKSRQHRRSNHSTLRPVAVTESARAIPSRPVSRNSHSFPSRCFTCGSLRLSGALGQCARQAEGTAPACPEEGSRSRLRQFGSGYLLKKLWTSRGFLFLRQFRAILPDRSYGAHMAKQRIPDKLKPWIDARKRFRLSHAHIQMARELGMNPKKFGGLANHRQERWKLPLPQFIAEIYFKRFERMRRTMSEASKTSWQQSGKRRLQRNRQIWRPHSARRELHQAIQLHYRPSSSLWTVLATLSLCFDPLGGPVSITASRSAMAVARMERSAMREHGPGLRFAPSRLLEPEKGFR